METLETIELITDTINKTAVIVCLTYIAVNLIDYLKVLRNKRV